MSETVVIDDSDAYPVYLNMETGFTYQVELSYLKHRNPAEKEKEHWVRHSLFLAQLPGDSTETVWKPLEYSGVRGLSRPHAADCIQRLIEATLIQDFDSIDFAQDLRWPMLKMMAVYKGLHYWKYDRDFNIIGEPRGFGTRVSLYNLVGTELTRERTWDLLIGESQPFEVRFVDRNPVVIKHVNKKDK